jgi:predicted transcriptional regulator
MNPLGSNKEIVQNKLIIMYILHRLNIPASNGTITKLVLETRLMNYFMFQQCFNELCEGGLVALEKSGHGKAEPSGGYILTKTGNNTLRYFIDLISQGIKKQLDKITPAVRREIEEDSLITADYIPESEDKFTVICNMREKGFPLIELKATVGTKKDALLVCENWKNHSSEIYAEIIGSLTKPR